MPARSNSMFLNLAGIAFALSGSISLFRGFRGNAQFSNTSRFRRLRRRRLFQPWNFTDATTVVPAAPIRPSRFGVIGSLGASGARFVLPLVCLVVALSVPAIAQHAAISQHSAQDLVAAIQPPGVDTAANSGNALPGKPIRLSYAYASEAVTVEYAPAAATSRGLDASHTQRWVELVQRSAEQLDATRIPNADAPRRGLESALSSLERFLSSSPTQGPLWTSFLQLDTMKQELNKPNPNLEVLLDLEKRFRQNHFGLEQPPFTAVRDALARFVPSQRLGAEPSTTIEILKNRLKRLHERLQLPTPITDEPNAIYDLAQTLSFLQQGNQAPELVSTIRNHFASPNVRVQLSSDFLRRYLSRPVHESNPVNELILGTTIVGQSVLRGAISPQLLDSPTKATLRLNLMADFASSNQGYNRSVVLQTQGSATIAASESIALTESGLVAFGDTGVDADLQSVINSIQHRLRIVRKIAAKQAAKQKPQADAIGEARLEQRIRTQFHQQLETQLAEANVRLARTGEPVLARLGLPRPARSSWSTPQHLAVQWNVRSGVQLAADGPCPIPQPTDAVCLQLHQSVVGNLLDPILSGRVLRSSDMDQYIAQFGDLASSIARKQEDGPWAITMDSFQPVEVHLDDSLIRFRIRTLRLEGPDEPLKQSALIEAAYRVQLEDGSVQLLREGDINVEFSGKQQRGGRASALRTLLRSKFEQLFRPQLFDAPLQWSNKLPELLKDLKLASLAIDDGWMQITFK